MNKLILIGNLTKDPETRTTQSGKTVCSFDLAVNDRQGNASYFRISVWEKQGENCQRFLSKGKKVMVAGPVSARCYTTGIGETRVSIEVTANEVEFLSPATNDSHSAPAAAAPVASTPGMIPVDEEVPF